MYFYIFIVTKRINKMVRYEIIKQLRTPFLWLFMIACVLANALSVLSRDYEIRQILRECETADILGTTNIADAELPEIEDELTAMLAESLKYSHSEFIPKEYADGLLTYIVLTANPARMSEDTALTVYDLALPQFRERVAEINSRGEYKYLNGGDRLHGILFIDLLLPCAVETMLFALLIAPKCAGHEYFSGTTQEIYCTKKGRSLASAKLFAAVLLTETMLAALTVTALAVFLIRCPCFSLLASPMLISSDMRTVIPWAEMSVIGYFSLSFITAVAVSAVFVGVGYAWFGLFVNSRANLYLSAAGALIFTILLYASYAGTPRELHTFPVISNPVVLLLNRVGSWFAVSERGIAVPWFEVYALAAWGALFAVLCVLAVRRIKKVSL